MSKRAASAFHRPAAISAACLALMLGAGEVAAQARQDREPPNRRPAAVARPAGVGELLDQLSAAKDEAAAKGLAVRIERIWRRSGSDTADLLMSRAVAAISGGDVPLGIELLDRTLALKPDWAEAWSQRATAFFTLGDYQRAMLDLQETLRREPRHFNALAGVGIIFQAYGDEKNAFAAYRRALAVHPFLENVRKSVDRLSPNVEGRDL